MKKQFIAIGLAGLLSVPSVVFAEATWYASLRTGISTGGGDTTLFDGYSRIGVRGSAEIGEGMTASLRWEQGVNTVNATLPVSASDDAKSGYAVSGRLSYVGLTTGLGTLNLGHMWSSVANHVGFTLDQSNYLGDDMLAASRVSDMLSFSSTSGPVSVTLEGTLAGGSNTVGRGMLGVTYATEPVTVRLALDNNRDAAEPDESGLAVTATIAGFDMRLGYTRSTLGGAEVKGIHWGTSGDLSDSGLSYNFQIRSVEDAAGESTLPYMIGIGKDLGGGASVSMEHANNDDGGDATTVIVVKVDM